MDKEQTKTDNRMRRYIRITDGDMWAKIDKIMTLDKYSKSFNKVIIDALYFGLDELIARLFETVEEVEDKPAEIKLIRRVDGLNEEYFSDIAKLLKELIIDVTVNKSILCSLYNERARALNKESVSGKKFAEGRYAETPDYLSDYEIRVCVRCASEVSWYEQPTDHFRYSVHAVPLKEKRDGKRTCGARGGAGILRHDGNEERVSLHNDGGQTCRKRCECSGLSAKEYGRIQRKRYAYGKGSSRHAGARQRR